MPDDTAVPFMLSFTPYLPDGTLNPMAVLGPSGF